MSVTTPPNQAGEIEKIQSKLLNPLPRLGLRSIVGGVIAVLVLAWGINGTEARPQRIIDGIPALVRFVTGLLPPEFEFKDASERAISFPGFQSREISPTAKVDRAKRASEDAIANLAEGQRLFYVLQVERGGLEQVITAEAAAEYDVDEVESLRPYIADAGMSIVLDDWDQTAMVAPEGFKVYYSVPYQEGQVVVAKRYVLNDGELLIGYPVIIDAIIETVQIAIIGTLGAIFLSMPFALLAARNISPHPTVYYVTRLFLNINRSIPTLIWALIMVSAVGLGPFAGVMALFVSAIGYTARLYADSFEQIDPNQVAAVRATGAGPIQVFNFGVLPQAFPLLATYSLISFEGNVRESTILGIVGAGGVGFVIQKYTALFQFNRLMGAVVIIAIMVTIIDRVSDTIRKRII